MVADPPAVRPTVMPGLAALLESNEMPSNPAARGKGDGPGRRRAPRLAVAIEASLSGRAPRSVTVIDLSLVGCLVRGDAVFDVGAIFDLALTLEGSPLAVKVRVAETSLDGDSLSESRPRHLAGLQFLSLPAADELRLRSFLESEGRRRRSADTPPA